MSDHDLVDLDNQVVVQKINATGEAKGWLLAVQKYPGYRISQREQATRMSPCMIQRSLATVSCLHAVYSIADVLP
jgi:hypothetical protein